ncbi:MAG: adenine phosphoribosyltransferase [Desulfurococcales archaeon]|nr:adenine phosphoribosyltransferase [Desulfurococcales archaeon]
MLRDVRIFAIELLRAFKKVFKYRELEEITGLPAPALWRYINMKIMPTAERAQELVEKLTVPSVIEKLFQNNIIEVGEGIYNVSGISYNLPILKILSYIAYREFHQYDITAVATVEVDGIPVAVSVGDIFDSKLVIAKRRPEFGIKNYFQTSYLARDPPAMVNLYLPATSLNINDRVLLVDDLLHTGRTSVALLKLVRMSGATPVGLFSLMAVGDRWRDVLKDEVDKIYVVKHLPGE